MKKQYVIFVVAVLVMFSALTGCKNSSNKTTTKNQTSTKQEQPVQDVKTDEFSVAYDSTDVLNPYRLKTVGNRYVAALLYDSLVKIDTEFRPQKSLASEISVGPNVVKVVLEQGLKFSDGTPITSADVKYSLDMARGENSPYAFSLRYVDSSIATDNLTLEIYLQKKDVNFENLLIFPIIKDGQGLENVPVSSGRFTVNGSLLVPNNNYRKVVKNIKKIHLVEIDQKETVLYSIQKNIIDMYFSVESNYARGAMPISYNNVNMNRLVYIGINNLSGNMASVNFKKAVDMVIDRSAINNYVYSSAGLTAKTPFNPDFYDTGEKRRVSILDAAKILDSIGYDKIDSEGWRMNGDKKIRLRLLVHSDNSSKMHIAQMIKKQLVDVGIDVEIDAQPFDEYKLKLLVNDFDMYIAEMGIPENMDISALLSPNDRAGYGTAFDNTVALSFDSYQRGDIKIEEFLDEFSKNPPFFPLVYRNGILLYSKKFDTNIISTEQDVFYNISEW